MELFLELKEILNTSHCHSLLQASDSSLGLERNTSVRLLLVFTSCCSGVIASLQSRQSRFSSFFLPSLPLHILHAHIIVQDFCTFYLPVAIGMILSNIKDERAYDEAKNICSGLDSAEAFKSVKFCEVKGDDNVPSDVFELVYERRSNNCMYKSSK